MLCRLVIDLFENGEAHYLYAASTLLFFGHACFRGGCFVLAILALSRFEMLKRACEGPIVLLLISALGSIARVLVYHLQNLPRPANPANRASPIRPPREGAAGSLRLT